LQKKLRESEIQSKQLRDQQRSIREQKVKKGNIFRVIATFILVAEKGGRSCCLAKNDQADSAQGKRQYVQHSKKSASDCKKRARSTCSVKQQ